MIGQEKLKKHIASLDMDTFPRSIILLGLRGSGKKHFINHFIQPKLNISIIDITQNISQETISEIYMKPEPSIYLVDIREISIKEQNILLKLVEEPLKNAYIIFIGTYRGNFLSTILNRCQIWELEVYTENQLKYFCEENFYYILEYCKTPGDVIQYTNIPIEIINSIIDICDKMIQYISTAAFSNTLTISDRISYSKKEGDKKWDYLLFCNILQTRIISAIKNNPNKRLFDFYYTTSKLLQDNAIAHINFPHLFENYLYHIKNL